jgi:hypothetical protein
MGGRSATRVGMGFAGAFSSMLPPCRTVHCSRCTSETTLLAHSSMGMVKIVTACHQILSILSAQAGGEAGPSIPTNQCQASCPTCLARLLSRYFLRLPLTGPASSGAPSSPRSISRDLSSLQFTVGQAQMTAASCPLGGRYLLQLCCSRVTTHTGGPACYSLPLAALGIHMLIGL